MDPVKLGLQFKRIGHVAGDETGEPAGELIEPALEPPALRFVRDSANVRRFDQTSGHFPHPASLLPAT